MAMSSNFITISSSVISLSNKRVFRIYTNIIDDEKTSEKERLIDEYEERYEYDSYSFCSVNAVELKNELRRN
jgi:hypothetical protein